MQIINEYTSLIVSIATAISTVLAVVSQLKKNANLIEVNDYKTYLLLLISDYPNKADEIYFVGRHYFEDLDGDSFVLPLFEDWLDSRGADKPEWFLEAKKKHKY